MCFDDSSPLIHSSSIRIYSKLKQDSGEGCMNQ